MSSYFDKVKSKPCSLNFASNKTYDDFCIAVVRGHQPDLGELVTALLKSGRTLEQLDQTLGHMEQNASAWGDASFDPRFPPPSHAQLHGHDGFHTDENGDMRHAVPVTEVPIAVSSTQIK